MFRLETERLELIVALLIARFPLRVLLLLQLEDFFERSSSQRGRDIVFAVEVLSIENALAKSSARIPCILNSAIPVTLQQGIES